MEIRPFITRELEKILSKHPTTGRILFPYYRGMIAKEIQIVNICKEDKVLCIGGGSFPCTALEIALKTGADVEVVDIDPIAIDNSRRVIKKYHLDKKIKVFQEAGQEVDPSNFTVIHIARQACPHEEILNNILKKATQGTRILVRSPTNSLKDIYRLLQRARYCDKYSCMEKKYTIMKETLLYIKNLGGKNNEKASPVYGRDTAGGHHPMAG
ncbi:class I SAM-dependent methyltransferase [Clostridium formicaceticum]|uniref:Nicotianamine synthase protein n=1 Tax=Clostridium formicaceticum TaxID=1497 RepID=A0AAC9RHH7_9CLOT|nr:class I SAM-dependent methyltransferase [Clostridium formicaceticum]AOY75826.1 hypothetical protein BJL90_07875 [Clostridium formicaceticum]ARE86156.1 hypothetical protein CLFO_04720 [Clostridium formicaceticum]